MRILSSTKICLLLLIIISLIGIRQLFLPGYFENHDGIIHVMRLAHFDEALKNGHLPVRWLPTWMAGYGSPVFNFNWSLPFYLGSILHTLGLSYQTSIEAIFIIGYVLSAIFSFLFLKGLLKNNFAALVGSTLYVWAPYRFTNIFVRGALGEATSFMFIPLILWLFLKIGKSTKLKWIISAGMAIGLFILTHNVMALVGSFLFFIFAIFLKYINELSITFLGKIFFAFVLGLSLSSFFWLPAIVEIKYNEIANLKSIYNVNDQFPTLKSLFNSKWQYAYAVPMNQEFSMSFQLGYVHWAMIVFAILIIVSTVKTKDIQLKFLQKQAKFFVILFIFSIFLVINFSRLFYQYDLISSINNFPWRYLEVATFASSVLGGLVIAMLERYFKLAAIFGIFIVWLCLLLYWPFSRIISWQYSATDLEYRSMIKTNINFLPDTEFLPLGTSYLSLLEDRGPAYNRVFFEDTRLVSKISNFQKEKLSYFATIENSITTEIRANTFFFPGWQLYIDDKKTAIDKDEYGLIKFNLEPGKHNVQLVFKNTPIRSLANWISIASFVLLMVLLMRELKIKLRPLIYKHDYQ